MGRTVSCPHAQVLPFDPSTRLSAGVPPVGLGSWEPPVREPLAASRSGCLGRAGVFTEQLQRPRRCLS